MEAGKTFWRRMTPVTISAATTIVLGMGLLFWPTATIVAQNPGSPAAISGNVTADQNVVQAFRVKARDTIHKITYTVFTNKGRYQIFNLPPSTYEVQVLEEGFDAPVQTVEVKAGETKTLNLGLKVKAPSPQEVELVDFDTLYPPSPALDVLLKSCFPCHGPRQPGRWHLARTTEAEWRRKVNLMFDTGVVTYETVSAEQKESIIKYFANNFGLNSKARDLKTDPLVRDEEALSETIYIQYELPPAKGPAFSNGGRVRRGVHSLFPSHVTPGIFWGSDLGSSSIVSLDTRNPDYNERLKDYRIPNSANINVTPHGIVEDKGRVYWVERFGDHIGELSPETGEIRRVPLLTPRGQAHSLRADSRGNLWYSYFTAAGKIGKFDPVTKKVTELEPLKGKRWNGYGIVVDKQDRVWANAFTTPSGTTQPVVFMYDQKIDKWTSFPTSSPTRRLTVDSKGKIWACEYFGNAIVMIDPDTGHVTEYKLPLKFGNPYEVWADLEDNLWIENAVYNSLVKFDQKTKKFTYFPFPDLRAHTPKVEVDSEGTIWFDLGTYFTAFKAKGNRPVRTASE